MTYDDIINSFKKHLSKINCYNNDFEVWLATTIELVYENFGLISPQHDSITQIQRDYNFAKIRDKSAGNIYAKKATQLIENYIEQIEEKRE